MKNEIVMKHKLDQPNEFRSMQGEEKNHFLQYQNYKIILLSHHILIFGYAKNLIRSRGYVRILSLVFFCLLEETLCLFFFCCKRHLAFEH